jgi:hypothetical protein
VEDPSMEGRVKITVIATGFDHNRSARRDKDTPTDMSAYASTARSALPADERMVANGGPRVIRRAVLDISKLPFTAVSDPDGASADDANPLDLPTFIRRQEG